MADTIVSLGHEMQRLTAATAAARKAVDEAVRELEIAEKNEKAFEDKLSALAGAVVSVTKQNTQVTATTSGAASSAAPASGAGGAASNGGVGAQSAVTSEQRLPKGAPKKKQVPQKKPANTDWRRFLPRPIDTEWATGVDRWFTLHAVGRYSFLTTDGLPKTTVKLMAKLSIADVMSVMEKSKSGPFWMTGKGGKGLADCRPNDMRKFVTILSGNLQHLQELEEYPDAQRDAQTSAPPAVYEPVDHHACRMWHNMHS